MTHICMKHGWLWIVGDQILFSYSSSGASVVAIDNKIEQAMVSVRLTAIILYSETSVKHGDFT